MEDNLFHDLLEISPESIIIVDHQGMILRMNGAAERTFGYNRAALIGKSVAQLVPEAKRPEHMRNCANYFTTPQTRYMAQAHTDVDGVREDGSRFPVEISLAPFQTKEGPVAVAIVRDVTERRRTERSLKESEEKYRKLVDDANDAIVVADAESGIILEANKQAEELFKRPLDQLIGMPQSILHPPDEAEKYRDIFQEYVKKGRGITKDLVAMDSEGRRVPVEVSGSVMEVGGRSVLQGIFRDITERKKAEEALREERNRAQGYLDIAGAMLVVLGGDGKVEMINKKGSEILGYGEQEIVGKNWFDNFIPESLRSRVREVFSELMAGRLEPVEYFENPVLTKTGEERLIAFHNTILSDETGRPTGSLSSGEDITERWKAQEALRLKDRQIRQAYVDVFGAVTGDRLIIMTEEELEAALGGPVSNAYAFSAFEDLAGARDYLRQVLEREFPKLPNMPDLVVAACEAMTNSVKHAGGGSFTVFRGNGLAQILITDHGPGIDFSILPKATLTAGFSTKATLGIGFTLMLEFCDRLLLATEPGRTSLVLEMAEDGRKRAAVESRLVSLQG